MKIKILLVVIAAAFGIARAEQLPSELLDQRTIGRIKAVAASIDGVLGVYSIDLTDGRTLSMNANATFPTASAIKVPIMMEMFAQAKAGKFKLTDTVTIPPADSVPGSGHLQILLRRGPVTLTVLDLITAMIETSDNTATNRCISMVGMDSVNRAITTLGLRNTRLQRRMLDVSASKNDLENISTPVDMARLFEMIYRGKTVDEGTSREMIRILKLVDEDIAKAVPAGIEVAAKSGELTGVRCEAAIVFHPKRPFAAAIMSTYLTPGENPVGAVAHILYEHYDRIGRSNRYGNRVE